MNTLEFLLKRLILPVIASIWAITAFAQKDIIDLSKLVVGKTVIAYNREVSIVASDPQKPVLHIDAKKDAGIAWLEGVKFPEGEIEFDVKGRNIPQQSFVGIAFHGSDNQTYDAIYFRPFNFRATEEERRNHSVQYISLPKYDWPKLRAEFPDKYEQPINPAPEPESWVHCRLVIKGNKISAFVNNSEAPSLEVTELDPKVSDKIGFWVGNGSEGDFANLTINASR
jgi:hypothetical protein